jgi:hypothetical protein
MSLSGTLEDFNPIELIAILDLVEKSGKLTLIRGDEEGLVVFRQGRIIYASSSGFRESLGSMLLARGLVLEDELVDALGTQATSAEEKRLGAILMDMGALSQQALDSVMLEQVVARITEFRDWDSGHFEFNAMLIENHGEVELQAGDLWTPLGLSPDAVLLRMAQDQDETVREAPPERAEPPMQENPASPALVSPTVSDPDAGESRKAASLNDLVNEQSSPQVKAEWMKKLLDQAAETFGRCLLFSVRRDAFRSIAQTGKALSEPSEETPLLRLALSRTLPSILGRCIATGHTVTASLPQDKGDHAILDALGGPSDGESVALPLLVRDEAVIVLYGDDLLEGTHSGRLESLESLIDHLSGRIEADIQAEITAEISAAQSA